MEFDVINFLYQVFVHPLLDEQAHYNVYNTLVYGILFAFGVVYIIPRFLGKLNLVKDRIFYFSLVPWVVALGTVRVWHDTGVVESLLFVTPFIYIWGIAGLLTLIYLVDKSLKLLNVEDWDPSNIDSSFFEDERVNLLHVILFSSGLIMLILSITVLPGLSTLDPLITGLTLFLVSSFIFVLALETVADSYENHLMLIMPFIGHLWDASSTFSGIMYGAEEKHVLANFFINMIGPSGIFLVKTIFVLPVVYYLAESDMDEKIYYLGLIGLLGVALGSRNFATLVTGA